MQKNAETENEENRIEKEKRKGNAIYFGQVVQLRHQFTNKYVHVSTEKMAKVVTTAMRVTSRRKEFILHQFILLNGAIWCVYR